MKVSISKKFYFEAAHFLPKVPEGHKCRNLHGHSYRIEIEASGDIDEEKGWLMDFADLRDAWMPIRAMLDHKLLNEVEGLENPTSENLARWIWEKMKPSLPEISAVIVQETETSRVTYRGE